MSVSFSQRVQASLLMDSVIPGARARMAAPVFLMRATNEFRSDCVRFETRTPSAHVCRRTCFPSEMGTDWSQFVCLECTEMWSRSKLWSTAQVEATLVPKVVRGLFGAALCAVCVSTAPLPQ